MSAPKTNGFSQIPHGFHKRLAELTGSELKVWMVHRCMEGKGGESYPSRRKLVEYTGLNMDTVTDARKSMRKKGWLTSSGQKRTNQGKFSIPIEHTTIPPVVTEKTPHGEEEKTVTEKTPHGAGVKPQHGATEKTVRGFPRPEVDPKSFEVDPNEVHPSNQPTPAGSDGGTARGTPDSKAAGTNQEAGKDESVLTEEVLWEAIQKAHGEIWTQINDDGDGRYEHLPCTPSSSGCCELFAVVQKRGLTLKDLPLLCEAYKDWFGAEYVTRFDEIYHAEGEAESRDGVYIPKMIQHPLIIFRKKLTAYLKTAREKM
jgi:hypothetical protein